MKKKKLTISSVLSTLAILVFMGWQYLSESSSTNKPVLPQKPKTSITASSHKLPVSVPQITSNYDYNMQDDPIGQNKNGKTHYYTLVLSWSPAFCDSQRKRFGHIPESVKDQCGEDKHFGWVVHGLWPQNKLAKNVADHPRFCQGDLPMVSENIIQKYLLESPSANLLQGEWEKHGACAFDKAEQYFEKQKELYRTLVLPVEEISSRNALFSWMKKHNPQLKNRYLGASHNELFICYGLNWQVIDCPKR